MSKIKQSGSTSQLSVNWALIIAVNRPLEVRTPKGFFLSEGNHNETVRNTNILSILG